LPSLNFLKVCIPSTTAKSHAFSYIRLSR
jgi:hypothetical protein